MVWRRSIRFWEAQRSYFSSLKPLKWPSDLWVTFGQHLLPKIWPKNGLKSPFFTFLKWRGVLRDEFLWSHFFTSEKYDIRGFQNHAECPHTTSGYFFSISWKMHKTTRIFGLLCVTRKYRHCGDTQDVVWRRSIRFWEAQRSYFSSLKPLKLLSDLWVILNQHLLPQMRPKND